MIGWTIFLVALWLIWFCAAKRWVFPHKQTELGILIRTFKDMIARIPGPGKNDDSKSGE